MGSYDLDLSKGETLMNAINNSLEKTQQTKLDVPIITWMLIVHLLAIAALFYFSWSGFFIFLILNFMTGCLGITFCYHRLISHRSFKANKFVEGFTALCGTLALQGTIQEWVAHHRVHHRLSDKDGDPHNASKGFWYSHMAWMLIEQPELKNKESINKLTKDIANNSWLMFLSRPLVMVGAQIALGLILLAIGGLSWVLWGIFFRLAFSYHVTWFVNSATHKWGYRTFHSNDLSRNNWWVGILAWGEGWHNNHHRYGNVCPAGFRWWEIDVTYMIIKMLSWMNLTYDIRMFPSSAYTESIKSHNDESQEAIAEASIS